MAPEEWYRRTTWSATDEAAFFARLARSRGMGGKAQYLRIQALYLQRVGTESMLRASLKLLEELFAKYPVDTEMAQAYLQKGQCLAALKDYDGALNAIRESLAQERRFPNSKTQAWIEYGLLVVNQCMVVHYDEVLAVLEEFSPTLGSLTFPLDRYHIAAIRALIASERGRRDGSREFAREALAAASLRHSGLRYHPQVGLVEGTNTPIHKRLLAIVSD